MKIQAFLKVKLKASLINDWTLGFSSDQESLSVSHLYSCKQVRVSLFTECVFSIRHETKSIATSGFYNICSVPRAELFLLFSSKVPKKNFH